MIRFFTSLLLAFLFFCSANAQEIVKNEWIVQSDQALSETILKRQIASIQSIQALSSTLNIYLIKTDDRVTQDKLEFQLTRKHNILGIAPNRELEKRMLPPNDQLYSSQWGISKIGADKVWNETTGGTMTDGQEIVVAVLDVAFDVDHEDLKDNIWINEAEIPGNGIDDDANGYIDDTMGVNMDTGTSEHLDNDPHGSQVAGIIGASANNEDGIAGVNWDAKLFLVSGISQVAEIISGLDYVARMRRLYNESNGEKGAFIVVNNYSGGLSFNFPDKYPGWCDLYNELGEVGVLSVGSTANENFDIELQGDLPTLCSSPYLIMVTNTDRNDSKVLSAGESSIHVDLGAPGEGIISTSRNNSYVNLDGTSASAPHISGAVALLYSIDCPEIVESVKTNPSSLGLTIKEILFDGVDELPTLANTVTGGRLNVFSSVLLAAEEICGSVAPGDLEIELRRENIFIESVSSGNIQIKYNTDNFNQHSISIHDAAGQLVALKTFEPSAFGQREIKIEFQISQFASGIYFLSIEDGEKIETAKFSVTH